MTRPKKKAMPPRCPRCGGRQSIKSGMVQKEQRWKCKACDFQYTRIMPRGRPLWQKSLVVFLYSYGVPMRQIARIFHVQPSTVLKWVRLYAKEYRTPEMGNVHIMKLAEMQRHIQKRGRKDAARLCIAIDDEAFKQNLGITITPK
jgi:transposase